MLGSLSKINDPLARSFAFASSAFTITSLIAAIMLGFNSNSKDKAIKKVGLVPLVALFTGAAVGVVFKHASVNQAESFTKPDISPKPNINNHIWEGWKDFRVSHKEPESQEITSFYFHAVDEQQLPDFKPGQYLTIKLNIPGESRPVIRSYSFSDFARLPNYYRLSIKREGAPKNLDVPPGLASNFMHDQVTVGSVISCKPPNGKFFLEVDSLVPVVLLSNGVGITPMVSMAKACALENPDRHVWFVHGARNGEHHALRAEMNILEKSYPNLHLHYCYSRAMMRDAKMFHHHGYADTQLVAKTIIPQIEQVYGTSAHAEYYLCGSPAFMDSLIEGLAKLGVKEENVFFESFGGGKTKGKSPAKNSDHAETKTIESSEVVFSQSDLSVTWTPEDGTLLELAQAHSLEPNNSCCQGVCMICMCRLEEGEVDYVEDPADEPDADSVLVCIAKPKTKRVVIDL